MGVFDQLIKQARERGIKKIIWYLDTTLLNEDCLTGQDGCYVVTASIDGEKVDPRLVSPGRSGEEALRRVLERSWFLSSPHVPSVEDPLTIHVPTPLPPDPEGGGAER